MPENNVQNNYLEILKKLKTSKEEHNEEHLELSDILEHSNTLFCQISNASELKLDAKVTEIHSEIFLKLFTRNIQNRKVTPEIFIKMANTNKLNAYFNQVMAINRKCSFAKFIDFDYEPENKERKTSERTVRVVKDATTPSGQNEIDEDKNPFIEFLDKVFAKNQQIFLYDCILDCNSFDKTVENIFNVAIAVRSKIIMFKVENDRIYIVKYKATKGTEEKPDSHVIMDINYEKYLQLVDKYRK